MRILFVTIEDITLHRGSSTHVREKVAALRQRGHTVTLLAGSEKEAEFGNFIGVGSCRNRRGTVSYSALAGVFLKLLLRIVQVSRKAHIVYANGPVAAFAAVLTKPLHHAKIFYEVTSLENEEIGMKGRGLRIAAIAKVFSFLQYVGGHFSDRTLVITEQIKDYFVSNYNLPDKKLKVLGVTTDLNKFHPICDPAFLQRGRERFGIAENSFLISYIGNLAHWQDFDMLIKGAKIVIRKNPHARFMIIGDGSQREALEHAVKRDSLDDRILIAGSAPHIDVPLCINISDICISLPKQLTSGYSPMKLFEYLACGKPVVATKVRGYEAVERAEAGILVDEADYEAFASAILRLAEDKRLRAQFSEKALQFARENFGWEKVIATIEAEIKDLGVVSNGTTHGD